jgi:hypothetical protein
VNTDTKLDAIVTRCSGISLIHPVLPLGGTTQCINDTGEFDEQSVSGSFDDAPSMFADLGIDHVGADRS